MHLNNLVTIKHMVKEKIFRRALYLTHDYDSTLCSELISKLIFWSYFFFQEHYQSKPTSILITTIDFVFNHL